MLRIYGASIFTNYRVANSYVDLYGLQFGQSRAQRVQTPQKAAEDRSQAAQKMARASAPAKAEPRPRPIGSAAGPLCRARRAGLRRTRPSPHTAGRPQAKEKARRRRMAKGARPRGNKRRGAAAKGERKGRRPHTRTRGPDGGPFTDGAPQGIGMPIAWCGLPFAWSDT